MDQKSLETLARFKEQLKAQPVKEPPAKGCLTPEDFKFLANCLGVAGYERVKTKRKKRKFKKKDAPERTKSGELKRAKDIHNPAIPTKAPKQENQSKPGRKWLKRLCISCGMGHFVHIDWKMPPKRCKPCRKANKFWRSKGSSKGGRTQYSVTSFVPGGAPGGGKRR